MANVIYNLKITFIIYAPRGVPYSIISQYTFRAIVRTENREDGNDDGNE